MYEKLKQNQRVKYTLNSEIGYGRVVGIATTDGPFGHTYIIEPDNQLNITDYDYSHFVCPHSMLSLEPSITE